MRVGSFLVDGRNSYGVFDGQQVREPGRPFRLRFPDLRSVMAAAALQELGAEQNGSTFELEQIRFRPLIPNPDKVLCIGVNYRPHVEEMGRDIPEYPVVFVRFPGSQTGHGEPLFCPAISKQYDFEGELALVIGKRARHVARQDAYDVIAGYCCFMDGSVRDWQRHTPQFTAGKNFASSGAIGPWLVTSDEITDPGQLEITTRVNGRTMQSGKLNELIFDIPALIEYCSTFTELLPGDVIATGTPGGVGAARTPPAWLAPGDQVEVDIPGVGLLVNTVRAESSPPAP